MTTPFVKYTLFDVVKRTGIKRDTLNNWKDKGYIKATWSRRDVRGLKTWYSFWDIHGVVLFQAIIKQGIMRKLAAEIVESIRGMRIDEPNIKYRNRDYLVCVRQKTGEIESEFYSQSDFIKLNDVCNFWDFENMYVWNFKNIRDQVEVIIK